MQFPASDNLIENCISKLEYEHKNVPHTTQWLLLE